MRSGIGVGARSLPKIVVASIVKAMPKASRFARRKEFATETASALDGRR
jgi:hypothetical protein